MAKQPKTTPIDDGVCPECGEPLGTGKLCPHCELILKIDPNRTPANILPSDPSLWPNDISQTYRFEPTMTAVFQLLPSGTVFSYTLATPLIVGRGALCIPGNLLDLSPFQGERHGVSREHCRFWRQNDCLLMADLGSTNGTYLKGQRVTPFHPYVVRHDT
ncbi:MAG: FHA domain-containing protein, partial [Anaerolineae bacterium]|nr:FHA domain-containing protein [Anaerolineae bacterium]